MELEAPCPTETNTITEAMPMMIPSIVRPVLVLLDNNAENVSSNVSFNFTGL
jgi:hypothetical protein